MSREFIFFIVSVGLFMSCSQHDDKSRITIGKIDSIYSDAVNEYRTLWIHDPRTDTGDTLIRYPVLYLLDGDTHFYSIVGLVDQLSRANGNDVCPPMIVVGILNTDRNRDMTPTHAISNGPDMGRFESSGGAEKFLDFVERELIPFVNKSYPASNERILVGHSFGGLLVIHTLYTRPQLFEKYLAIDPSLWWDRETPLRQYLSGNSRFDTKSLFVGVANTFASDTATALKDTTRASQHYRSIMRFVRATKTRSSGLRFSHRYYPGQNHVNVPLIASFDAMPFLFPKTPVKMPVDSMKHLEGKYAVRDGKVDVQLSVRAADFGLIVTDPHGGKVIFTPTARNTFYCAPYHSTLVFDKIGDNGSLYGVFNYQAIWRRIK